MSLKGFPGGSAVKNLPAIAGDSGWITGLGGSPGEGNPLQYSCWKSPMDREACKATLHAWGHKVRHDFTTKQHISSTGFQLKLFSS